MNMWEHGFDEPPEDFPNDIVQRYVEIFESAAGNYASLYLIELDELQRMTTSLGNRSFQFELKLASKVVTGYSFSVMKIGYDPTIYPVAITFEDGIVKEMGVRSSVTGPHMFLAKEEAAFIEVLEKALTTERFKRTVGGLIKIAKSKESKTEE